MGTEHSFLDATHPEVAFELFSNMAQIIDAGFDVGRRAITLVDSIYPTSDKVREKSKQAR
jgi:hypothetical protein